ncbi:peptide deformylase, partial [Candidatus Desantisbacteria bacterium]|nr:peptide deformylase [Candidatus Desantisbacteria bacterium]
MALRKIITYGDPVLREKTAPVTEINKEIIKLANDMIQTRYNAPGV